MVKPLRFILAFLILGTATIPSWAWRGGFRGGVGIYLGPGWYGYPYSPYPYYDPYYYDPYNAYYDPNYPYASQEQAQTSPDNSRHGLAFIERQISRERERVQFEYDDGDISKEERNAVLRHLAQIRTEARAEGSANGGYLTGDQESALLREIHSNPESYSREEESAAPAMATKEDVERNLKPVTDKISLLRTLLEKKLSEGNITKAQHDGLAAYLNRTEKQVEVQAAANGGALPPDQKEEVMKQLDRADHAIQQNLVAN